VASESRKTVLVALAANLVIAILKGGAGLLSGSTAMLAEAAHSVADTGNQGLLLVSFALSDRRADEDHPFGYGKERFFWAFLVAVFIFLLGGLFSILEGADRLVAGGGGERSPLVAYGVLAAALIAESVSFLRALRQTRSEARENELPLHRYVRASKDPSTKTIFSEDAAAIAGIVIAFLGIGLDQLTGVPFDPIASILIGLLLCGVAVALGRDVKGLLIGESARPDQRRALRQVMLDEPRVENVLDLMTMYLGPESLLVAARLDLADGISAAEVEELCDRLEGQLRSAVPDVDQVFLDATPGSRAARAGHRRTGLPADVCTGRASETGFAQRYEWVAQRRGSR
jgi:cation diffusion facilitator family transporter